MSQGLQWLGPRGRDGGIDTVPLPTTTGGLSLCGKHAIGPDWVAAMAQCGATTVVCLVEEHELLDRYPDYVQWLHDHRGGRALWFPIHDLHAPAVEEAVVIVDHLRERLEQGEHLLVHCAAGIGRAGTLATCVLIALGMDADDALRHVAAHRPMAGPEAGAQRDLVAALAGRRHG